MILYEYKCDCGFMDSYFHNMEEKPSYVCPECGKEMYKSLGLNFILNGYSSKNPAAHNIRKITQQVLGVNNKDVDKLDPKLRRARRAKIKN